MKHVAIGAGLLLFTAAAWAQQPPAPAKPSATPEALRAEIEALKSAKVAWREIVWHRCLLDGLKEARAKGKPVLLWVFIDRPADDCRC